ncbi:EscU/YscU/HrcU family type III secretion system export apparatus switch protein [Leptospira noguchii]|uniref:Flagellar biosynthesis protein FlhB n=1 Tax=Leptospira noguchii str. 2001034031 TaxID=1193053 RepID=M6XYL9_9LEPT|nr:EscU/YscU/HrcU family type III secretion system export apparatus switch protein [Leptospira noguchii]EMO87192.1 flagellar biosynthesis protein FlhB [Leptospira noguchii str. 2001034031]
MKEAIWLRKKKFKAVLAQKPEIFFVRIFYTCLFLISWIYELNRVSFAKSVLGVFYRLRFSWKRFVEFIFGKFYSIFLGSYFAENRVSSHNSTGLQTLCEFPQFYRITNFVRVPTTPPDYKLCKSSHNSTGLQTLCEFPQFYRITNFVRVPTIYVRSQTLYEFPQFYRITNFVRVPTTPPDYKLCESSHNLQNVVESESNDDHFSNLNVAVLQNKKERFIKQTGISTTSFIQQIWWEQNSTSYTQCVAGKVSRFFSISQRLFFKERFSEILFVGTFLFYKKIVKMFRDYSELIDSKRIEFFNSNLFFYFLQSDFINATIEVVRNICRFNILPPNVCLSTEAADFKIDLQLFAAEDEGRTEPGSERRRREEREKGNVPKSPELPAAVVLLAGVILVYLMGEYFFMRTYYILRKYIHGVGLRTDISSESVTELLKNASTDLFTLLWPLLGITLVGAIIGNVAQVGFIFTPRALSFNFSRIRPNFKKVLPTRQTLFNLGKSLAKVGLIAWVSYIIISKDFFPILLSGEMGLEQAVALVMNSSFKIFLIVGIILLAISIVDYLYQRYEYEESLKMTPSEAKREAKESDGDRSLQARRRQLARDMMNKRKMLAKVPEADVVITNPTHFAVALEYKPGIHKAPIVIAKGVDDFALLIIRIARENGVPTVEDRIQARGLYEEVELGAEVPQQFYRAIAAILSRLESFRRAV